MDVTQLILLQVIAHILVDFTFQSHKLAVRKNKKGFRDPFLKWHILIVFVTSWILSLQWMFAAASFVIALTHWILDGLKVYISRNRLLEKYVFFIDQALHVIIIVVTVFIYNQYFEIQPILPTNLNTQALLIVAAYLICSKPSNILVKEIFKLFEVHTPQTTSIVSENDDLPNAGKLIGVSERWIVLTLIIVGHIQAVGFLIAAKSILRFKNDDAIKTEYVLIGTLLSFGIAIAVGLIVKYLPNYLC